MASAAKAPAGPGRAPHLGTFASLKERDFLMLWMGQLGSNMAMNMQQIARGWLVFALTDSALKLAWVTLAFMVPQALLSLYGGVLADKFSKKRIQIWAQGLNCLLTLIMAAIILSGNVQFWHFIAFGFVNGTVLALSMPARTAMIPDLVPEQLVFNAMALSTASMNLCRILGPILAGLLIAWLAAGDKTSAFGVGIVYLMIAAQYALSSLTAGLIRKQPKAAANSRSTMGQIKDGVMYVRNNEIVLGLIVISLIPFMFGMSVNTMLPAFNGDALGGGADGLGIIMGAMGVGAIIGSLLLARLGQIGNKGKLVFVTAIGWGVFIALFAWAPNLLTACISVALVGFASSVFMAMNRGILQLQVRPDMRGRVMSVDQMTHGLMPFAVLPIGLLAEMTNISVALSTSGAIIVVCSLVLMWRLAAIRNIDQGYALPASLADDEDARLAAD